MVCPPIHMPTVHELMRRKVELDIGVYPYQSVNGVTVSWNSVIRRRHPGQSRWQVTVLPPLASPELAHENALNWVRSQMGVV